jgi:SAM-dependent methyltransferase
MMGVVKSPADKSGKSLLEAMAQVQALAFGPLLFQAARVLRDRGLLRELVRQSPEGRTKAQLSEATNTSPYGVTVLIEAGLAAGLVEQEDDQFRITKAGYLLERDPMTRVNMNFVGDVCYRAAEHLGEAIEEGRPSGLKELDFVGRSDFETVYEGLSQLNEPAKASWFEFDHFYSDDSFPQILPIVFKHRPQRILDVGGNTGKFALSALRYDEGVEVTVADLPGQIATCRDRIERAGLGARVQFHPFSILAEGAALPQGRDLIWMSQFLCCFSEDEVERILGMARRAMGPSARLIIMDTLWDRQKNNVAAMCLQATSLYFTTVANGNSRMYDGETLHRLIESAGLRVENEFDEIGWGHTILECVHR